MKYSAKIVRGEGRGARMDLPTINFEIPEGFAYPQGIYAGYIYANETAYPAALHYGPVPTFKKTKSSLEAFVLAGRIPALPGQPLQLELIRYLRAIRNFPDTVSLRHQIDLDIRQTKATFDNKNTASS